ncbi:MAG: ZIP family metal transporter [Patescibacteria group bacterium]|jgi:zinc and cadmium transporter
MLLNIIIASLLVSLLSLVGLAVFSKNRYSHKIMDGAIALAAGVLLGNVFFHMLPEIMKMQVENNYDPQQISLWILGIIIFLFFTEQYLHWHHCHRHHCDDQHEHTDPAGVNILLGDGIHNLVDGMVIAASFAVDNSVGWMATLAIALHEIPQEIGDFSLLLHSGFSKAKALFWNFISGLLAIVGAVATYFYARVAEHEIILISLAAGSFLYIAMSDIMPHLQEQKRVNQFTQILWFIIGLALIFMANKFFNFEA